MAINLSCDWRAGFVMDPTQKQRVGYLVSFEGMNMGEYLKPDITVFTPYNNSEQAYSGVSIDTDKKAVCVGVIESFSYGGGVGDPICISAYISAENAEVLSAKMKTTLDTTMVTSLAWWICNFDEENKVWYEEAHPMEDAVKGQLNAPGGKDVRLSIAQEATKLAPNIDINVYNLYMEVIPAADATYAFHFATSSKTKYVRSWGLKVGSNAALAMGS
jgi:hypothetical protein